MAWKSQKTAYEESLSYLKGRKLGRITSLKTPWQKLNNATVNGFEWHSMNVIGGRPGTGKTLLKDLIVNGAFKLNAAENFRVLEFSLEMLGKNTAIRSYSAHLKRSYKYLCSADGTLSDEDFNSCVEYARNAIKNPIDIVESAPTVDYLREIIENYMEQHASLETTNTPKTTKKLYTNTIITIDHSILVKGQPRQSRNDMLFDLGETLTDLKRKYPIIFIVLSQLNRNIDHPDRNEDGKYGNYVLESDIFGADALLQHADTVIGLNRPGKQKIRFYGPDRYIIESDRILVMHFLKCRYGEGGLAFFEAAYEHMSINEIATPPQQESRNKL